MEHRYYCYSNRTRPEDAEGYLGSTEGHIYANVLHDADGRSIYVPRESVKLLIYDRELTHQELEKYGLVQIRPEHGVKKLTHILNYEEAVNIIIACNIAEKLMGGKEWETLRARLSAEMVWTADAERKNGYPFPNGVDGWQGLIWHDPPTNNDSDRVPLWTLLENGLMVTKYLDNNWVWTQYLGTADSGTPRPMWQRGEYLIEVGSNATTAADPYAPYRPHEVKSATGRRVRWYRYSYNIYNWRMGCAVEPDEVDLKLDLYRVRRYTSRDTYEDRYEFVPAGSCPWSESVESATTYCDGMRYRSMALTLDSM
jgi:hypothetical protein